MQGHYAASRACHEESLQISRRLGNRLDIANAISNLGEAAFGAGDYGTARTLLKESLPLFMELKVAFNISATLTVLAAVEITDARGQAVRLGPLPDGSGVQVLRGVRLLGAAEGRAGTTGEHLQYVERGIFARAKATARELLGDQQYEATCSAGRALTLEQAVAYALEESVPDGQ
jgi:hypothetical protein